MYVSFIFTHYLLLIFIIWCVLFTFCLCFFFCLFVFGMGVPSLKPILFLFSPSHCSLLPLLTHTSTQTACQSKAQKKLQPLTQVPVLQEQGEYCAGLGGVWTWVPAVWLRGGGVCCFSSFPFMLQFCLSTFIFSLTSRDGLCDGTTLIPFSLSQRDAPRAEPASGWRYGVLSGVSVHLSVGSRGVSSCVCCQLHVHACVQFLGCINTRAF